MERSRWERLAPLTGAAFAVLAVIGNILRGSPPDFLDDPRRSSTSMSTSQMPFSSG